jgi:hypothetical protein
MGEFNPVRDGNQPTRTGAGFPIAFTQNRIREMPHAHLAYPNGKPHHPRASCALHPVVMMLPVAHLPLNQIQHYDQQNKEKKIVT